MTLLERCQNVRAQIERRNALRVADKDAEAFRKRSEEVETARTNMRLEVKRLVVLKRKGVIVAKPATSTVALDLVRELESRLASNADDSGRDYGRLNRAIDKVLRDLLSASNKALDGVNRDLPTIEETYLKQVELIPTYTDQVMQIRVQRDRLLRGQDVRSMSAEDLERFFDRRSEFRALADQLSPDEFPKEVLDFFKAARQGGAPLERFTATVQEWLKERDLLKSIRVQIQR